MVEERTEKAKTGRTFDAAYSFSFSIAVGLALFIAGLFISLALGQGTWIGLVFGIPLLIAGLVVPIFMMRDLFKTSGIKAPCPNCQTAIHTTDATLQLTCPNCKRIIAVKDMKLHLAGD